jgi:hypothetical protein
MATPNENVQTLKAYWKLALSTKLSDNATLFSQQVMVQGLDKKLYNARTAMAELLSQARNNPYVRTQTFAVQNVFSDALLMEAGGFTDRLIKQASGLASSLVGKIPPRLIMLDGIFGAGDGGFFAAADPAGLTSWLGSEDVSLAGISVTISNDPDPAVRASALRIIKSLALPVRWVQRPAVPAGQDQSPEFNPTQLEKAIKTLQAYLPASPWKQGVRSGLSDLASQAIGRLGDLAFQVAAKQAASVAAGLPGLSGFTRVVTGDGKDVPTTPPAPKPWYRNGQVLSAGAIAFAGGAVYAKHRATR